MQKDINTVFVNLTTAQQAKVPAQAIKTTKNNRKVIMITDLKHIVSTGNDLSIYDPSTRPNLMGENLAYQDILPSQFNTTPIATFASTFPLDPAFQELYHVVPAAFVTQYKGFNDAANQLNAVQTADGRWVCAFNTLYEFWDYFGGQTIQCVRLQLSDFPMFDINGNRTN